MKLGFIGTGKITSSVITGVCGSSIKYSKIFISSRNNRIAKGLKKKFKKISIEKDNQKIVDNSNWVFLAVTPTVGEKVIKKLKFKSNQILKINIAHNEGNYFTNSKHLDQLKKDNLIAFKYCDENGNINESSNPNGALENIAGIYNTKKNILGMMPHPERMVDDIISNTDGINLFSGLIN